MSKGYVKDVNGKFHLVYKDADTKKQVSIVVVNQYKGR